MALCSPIPGGQLTPAFILGAVFGRLYGYLWRCLGVHLGIELVKCMIVVFLIPILDEGVYAIVGAAALAASVTRTASIAMIVFEICGQTN